MRMRIFATPLIFNKSAGTFDNKVSKTISINLNINSYNFPFNNNLSINGTYFGRKTKKGNEIIDV